MIGSLIDEVKRLTKENLELRDVIMEVSKEIMKDTTTGEFDDWRVEFSKRKLITSIRRGFIEESLNKKTIDLTYESDSEDDFEIIDLD